MTIKFRAGGLELFPYVKPLWEELNRMNIARSLHFSEQYSRLDFNTRMRPVRERARDGMVRVELALNDGKVVGYCVISIDKDQVAELDSIFVEEPYRYAGVGESLLDRALDWTKAFPVRRIYLTMTLGNEDTPRFYQRKGFLPRMMVFEHR